MKEKAKHSGFTQIIGFLFAVLLVVSLFFTACEQPDIVPDEDATLKTLSVDKGILSPVFSASHFEYSVTVRNAYDTITVIAAANSGKAIVNGAGTKSLAEGINSISVAVKAESGNSKTYTITVTRLDSSKIGIESTEDMAKIGVAGTHPLSGDYILMNDITLANWTPVGAAMPFSGFFDGNGKKITLNSFNGTAVSGAYVGIFGDVKGASASAKAEIKNLTIQSSVNASTAPSAPQSVGLLTGYAEQAVIENITLTGTFAYNSTNVNYIGGVAGQINTGTLVKNINSSLKMDIVPGGGSDYNYVGGIVGKFIGGAGIENCHVTANVTADNVASSASGQVFVGGITGGSSYGFDTSYKGYIIDSSSTGTIIGRAKGDWTFAGGIAGVIVGGNVNNLASTTRIERCFVTGKVSTEGTSSGHPYVGGVVGYNYYGALVSQSYFNGTVIGTGAYAGGIAGYNSQTSAPNNSRIEDCWSGGTITGGANAGGIVGQNQVNTYIRRCYSTAAVSATIDFMGVGGIAGLNASVQSNAITACVALNPSLSSPEGENDRIHRIAGHNDDMGGVLSNNHARSDMTVTAQEYTPEKGLNNPGGADCAAKPNQSFYAGLGWDFNTVWTMGADYPKLKWQ